MSTSQQITHRRHRALPALTVAGLLLSAAIGAPGGVWAAAELLNGCAYSTLGGESRILTLWRKLPDASAEGTLDIQAVLDAIAAGIAFGNTPLRLLDSGLEDSRDRSLVWFGLTTVHETTAARETFDARVVRLPPGQRVLVVAMIGELTAARFEVYEVATGAEPGTFETRLSPAAELRWSEAASKPLAGHRALGGYAGLCLRDRLGVVVGTGALTFSASREDGSCEPLWARLDLRSLTWTELKVEPATSAE